VQRPGRHGELRRQTGHLLSRSQHNHIVPHQALALTVKERKRLGLLLLHFERRCLRLLLLLQRLRQRYQRAYKDQRGACTTICTCCVLIGIIGVGLLILATRGGALTVRSAVTAPHFLRLSLGGLRLHRGILSIDSSWVPKLVRESENNAGEKSVLDVFAVRQRSGNKFVGRHLCIGTRLADLPGRAGAQSKAACSSLGKKSHTSVSKASAIDLKNLMNLTHLFIYLRSCLVCLPWTVLGEVLRIFFSCAASPLPSLSPPDGLFLFGEVARFAFGGVWEAAAALRRRAQEQQARAGGRRQLHLLRGSRSRLLHLGTA
jgi:hypothetical protein